MDVINQKQFEKCFEEWMSDLLFIKGTIVIIDAIGYQKDIATKIA